MILGTPRYGVGDLPGLAVGCQDANWAEFVLYLDGVDLSGKRVALFGLGHQERYASRFASSLIKLYRVFYGYGADIAGVGAPKALNSSFPIRLSTTSLLAWYWINAAKHI